MPDSFIINPDFYDEDPRNNSDYASEDQILVQIEQQFNVSENNFNKEDYVKLYFKDLMNIDLDDESLELYQVEMKLETDDQRELFDYLMTQLKFMFSKYYGIDSTDLELDVADFEFIYNLYKMFILNLNKTLVDFLFGLKSKSNNIVSNPDNYTLQGGYKNYLSQMNPLTMLSQESGFSFEEIQNLNKSLDSAIIDDKVGMDTYTNSAQSFLDLCNRSIMDDNLLDIDNFFQILCLGDKNDTYLKFDVMINDGTIPFDIFKFRERIRSEIFLPENLDNLETLYRKRLESNI